MRSVGAILSEIFALSHDSFLFDVHFRLDHHMKRDDPESSIDKTYLFLIVITKTVVVISTTNMGQLYLSSHLLKQGANHLTTSHHHKYI